MKQKKKKKKLFLSFSALKQTGNFFLFFFFQGQISQETEKTEIENGRLTYFLELQRKGRRDRSCGSGRGGERERDSSTFD